MRISLPYIGGYTEGYCLLGLNSLAALSYPAKLNFGRETIGVFSPIEYKRVREQRGNKYSVFINNFGNRMKGVFSYIKSIKDRVIRDRVRNSSALFSLSKEKISEEKICSDQLRIEKICKRIMTPTFKRILFQKLTYLTQTGKGLQRYTSQNSESMGTPTLKSIRSIVRGYLTLGRESNKEYTPHNVVGVC